MTEYDLIEKPLIDALEESGWTYIPGPDLVRESYDVPLLTQELKEAVYRIMASYPSYSDIELEEDDFQRLLLKLVRPESSVRGMKEVLAYLKDGAIPLDLGKKGLRYLPIIDYERPQNNSFIVSNQVLFRGPNGRMEADIVLFVNGIPIVIIECKDPAGSGVSWYDAFRDIKLYEDRVPELFKYVQFGVAAAGEIKVFPIMPWENWENVRATVWRNERGEDGMEGIIDMLRPNTLLDILRNFVFITQKRGKDVRLLPRYMQYEAANRIYHRVIDRMEGRDDRSRGLIWHWQGSGKTFTMIFSAYKLFTDPRMEKPSIFFIVDRRDLQRQMAGVLGSMDLGGITFRTVSSIKDLKEIIAHDGGNGERGLFVLLIQKFRPDAEEEEEEGIDEEELKKEMENLPISRRKNIVLFIDEGHRTQYGDLAAEMRNIFREAFMFAFTGTPIKKSGKDTYMEFSYPEKGEKYLHRYFIDESVRDGYTVPIVYTFRKEESLFRKKEFEEKVEEIFQGADAEFREEVGKKIRVVNELLSGEDHIKQTAKDIADSFFSRENRQFKAMVVAASRKACVIYKKALDDYIRENYPDEYADDLVEVVMTYEGKEKEKVIEDYKRKIREENRGLSDRKINDRITENFREEERPKILVVTDMLLTGFDAPILQTMYIDKVLNGHTLLQAIARTNRPYGDEKEYGLIIDYAGMCDKFLKALSEYYDTDDREMQVAVDIAELEKDFLSTLEEVKKLLGPAFGPEISYERDRTALDKALGRVMAIEDGKKNEEIFLTHYRRLTKIYELLGPNRRIKADRTIGRQVRNLRALYSAYRTRFGKKAGPEEIERYRQEVTKALHDSLEIRDMGGETGELVIDGEFLEKLRAKRGDTDIIMDMASVLNRYVMKFKLDPLADIVYSDIIESIEDAVERWRKRESDPDTTLERFTTIAENISEREREEREIGLSHGGYLLYLYLKRELGDERPGDYVNFIKDLIGELRDKDLLFAGWYEKAETRRSISEIIRKRLLTFMLKERKMKYGEIKERMESMIPNMLDNMESIADR